MKAVVLTAMVLGTLVFWVDVDSVVARYNVQTYRSGKLETVDVSYINDLGSAGIPWLLELAEDEDPEVARQARSALDRRTRPGYHREIEDFRDWNFSGAKAEGLLDAYREERYSAIRGYLSEKLGMPITCGTLWVRKHDCHPPSGQRPGRTGS